MPRILAAFLFAALPLSLLSAPSHAADRKPVTGADSVTIVAGSKLVPVKVLANDRVWRKKRARVRILSKPAVLRARVSKNGKVIRVATRPAVARAVHTLVYQVVDAKGRRARGSVTVTVDSTTGRLPKMIRALPVADEYAGSVVYDRDDYKHWNAGSAGISYCDTRDEVLISESVVKASWSGSSCTITGKWFSYYDGVVSTNSSSFDIDHVVALKEGHESGAWAWDAARREAYANDQGDPRSLVAVSASSNRSKSDRDPSDWLPPQGVCRYLSEWTAVKTRWGLTVDAAEKKSLLAASKSNRCGSTRVAPVSFA